MLSVAKGFYFFKKLPNTIRKTEKGIHLIWYNVNCSEKEAYVKRKVIGDDLNRIKLDMCGNRLKQVLFSAKKTTTYGYIHPAWFLTIIRKKSKSKHYDLCDCGKKVYKAEKIYSETTKELRVYHTDNTLCVFKIKTKRSLFLDFMRLLGVKVINYEN
jgi:hypothetical protein